MQTGRKGIGSHKHIVSGIPTKSPKFRLYLKLEAEKNIIKSKKYEMFDNIKNLFKYFYI